MVSLSRRNGLALSSGMELVTQGIDILKSATQRDSDGLYEEALRLYESGCEYLLTGIKYLAPELEQVKADLRLKLKSYLNRAEQIKAAIRPGSASAAAAVPAAAAAAAGGFSAQGKPAPSSSSSSPAQGGGNNAEATAMAKLVTSTIVPRGELKLSWDDVAGNAQCKVKLQQAVMLPILQPQLFSAGGGGSSVKGVLLYGPPGTGKTELAKVVASQSQCTFFNVTSSVISSKWVGDSQKIVAALFEEAARCAPAVIFIDEIDSILRQRSDGSSGQVDHTDAAKTEFFIRWDGLGSSKGVLVIGATNLPWTLDGAARRRFDKRVYVPLPDEDARRRIFQIQLKQRGKGGLLTPEELDKLAALTDGYSGSDIRDVVATALAKPLEFVIKATHFMLHTDERDGKKYWAPCLPEETGARQMSYDQVPKGELANISPIFEDFEGAILETRNTVGKSDLKRFEEWTAEYGSSG